MRRGYQRKELSPCSLGQQHRGSVDVHGTLEDGKKRKCLQSVHYFKAYYTVCQKYMPYPIQRIRLSKSNKNLCVNWVLTDLALMLPYSLK